MKVFIAALISLFFLSLEAEAGFCRNALKGLGRTIVRTADTLTTLADGERVVWVTPGFHPDWKPFRSFYREDLKYHTLSTRTVRETGEIVFLRDLIPHSNKALIATRQAELNVERAEKKIGAELKDLRDLQGYISLPGEYRNPVNDPVIADLGMRAGLRVLKSLVDPQTREVWRDLILNSDEGPFVQAQLENLRHALPLWINSLPDGGGHRVNQVSRELQHDAERILRSFRNWQRIPRIRLRD